MTPEQRAKLQAAADLVADRRRRGDHTSASIIAELVRDHGASHSTRWDGNKLRCAGVTASCTWSADKGLLDNWVKTATVRLMSAPAEPASRRRPIAGLAWD